MPPDSVPAQRERLRIPRSVKDALRERKLLPPLWYVGPLVRGDEKRTLSPRRRSR